MNDATILLRDIAGDAATKAAGRINPTEDQLSQIDQPAEDNTWHETPNVGDLKAQARSQVPFGKKDVKEAAGDAGEAGAGARDPNSADAPTIQNRDDAKAVASDVDAKKGAKAGYQNFRNKMSDRFDEDQKEQMRQYRERTNNYFKEKVPKERREQVVFRLKKMLVEIQQNSDCTL